MTQQKLYDLTNNMQNSVSIGGSDESAGTVSGSSVDTKDIEGPVQALVNVGEISGSPTATSVTFSFEESDDASSWSAVATTNTTSVITAADTSAVISAHHDKRYVRVKAVVAFTGGSSPSAIISANVVGAKRRTGSNESGIGSTYPA